MKIKQLSIKNFSLFNEITIPFDEKIARIYSEGRLLAEDDPEYRDEFFELINKVVRMITNQITIVQNK